ncbi:MAG: hypothetical protein ACX931_06585 [Saccharospirillum sp.]
MNDDSTNLPGRRVRFDQLLVQPRVHLAWIRKSRALNFELTPALMQGFWALWSDYRAQGFPPPQAFLLTRSLHDQDRLFALFCSAWYVQHHERSLHVSCQGRVLCWLID